MEKPEFVMMICDNYKRLYPEERKLSRTMARRVWKAFEAAFFEFLKYAQGGDEFRIFEGVKFVVKKIESHKAINPKTQEVINVPVHLDVRVKILKKIKQLMPIPD